jgi:hypothetical protein
MEREREMHVLKRNGRREVMSFDKILHRIKLLGNKCEDVNYTSLAMKVIEKLYDCISTTVIDELSAEQCASMSSIHPDYGVLASRLLVSNHHKNTTPCFSKTMKGVSSTLSKSFMDLVATHKKTIDEICDYSRDYLIDYFGLKTLIKSYLLNANGFVERPQHMWLRIALAIHADDLEKVKETYYYMSMKYFTHATPTLYNAGTAVPQLSSCYLLAMESDSIEGIFNTVKDCALISKWGGRNRAAYPQCSGERVENPLNQRNIFGHRSDAARFQQYGQVRGPGGRTEKRQFCHLHRTMARRQACIPPTSKKSRRRGIEGARSLHGPLDARSLYETSERSQGMDVHVSQRVSRTVGRVRRGVRRPVREIRARGTGAEQNQCTRHVVRPAAKHWT